MSSCLTLMRDSSSRSLFVTSTSMTDCSTSKSWISDFRIRRRPWRSHGRLAYPRVHRSLIPRREFPSGYYPSGPYVFLYIRDFQLGKVNLAPCQTYFSAYDGPPSLYLISTAALGVRIRWRTELPARAGGNRKGGTEGASRSAAPSGVPALVSATVERPGRAATLGRILLRFYFFLFLLLDDHLRPGLLLSCLNQ